MVNEKLVRIKHRIDTSANWNTNNPILAKGEIGIDEDVNKIKIGDGTTKWNDLEYNANNISDSSSIGGIEQLFDSGDTFDFTGKNANATELDSTLTGNITKGATGNYASSFGGKSAAIGKRSHAEGTTTIAKGNYSHAEGDNSVALGDDSHAEGYITVAKGNASHSEGALTIASGSRSHAEGSGSVASGDYSHAEGNGSKATGIGSHSEAQSIASGEGSHAEGSQNEASGVFSHAEGIYSNAKGRASHSEGTQTTSIGENSHAEGMGTIVKPTGGHSEGYKTLVTNDITDISKNSSTENPGESTGTSSTSWNISDHMGEYSHAEGVSSIAYGYGSHAEGSGKAIGVLSHAEGRNTIAGDINEELRGDGAHAEGKETVASRVASHAEGYGTIASSNYQHVQGIYNIEDTKDEYAHIVGNGRQNKRSNAYTLSWGGYAWYQGNIKIGGSSYNDTNAQEIATKKYVSDVVSDKADLSNTLSGYQIHDAYTKTEIDEKFYTKVMIDDMNLSRNKYPINVPYKQLVTVGAISETTAKIIGNVSAASAYLISLCGDLGASSIPTFNSYIEYGSTYTSIQLNGEYKLYIRILSGDVYSYVSNTTKNTYKENYIIIVEPLVESIQSVTIS